MIFHFDSLHISGKSQILMALFTNSGLDPCQLTVRYNRTATTQAFILAITWLQLSFLAQVTSADAVLVQPSLSITVKRTNF